VANNNKVAEMHAARLGVMFFTISFDRTIGGSGCALHQPNLHRQDDPGVKHPVNLPPLSRQPIARRAFYPWQTHIGIPSSGQNQPNPATAEYRHSKQSFAHIAQFLANNGRPDNQLLTTAGRIEDAIVLDLSFGSTTGGDDPTKFNAAQAAGRIRDQMCAAGTDLAIGRYADPRPIYSSDWYYFQQQPADS
jgi:hypothetical protein